MVLRTGLDVLEEETHFLPIPGFELRTIQPVNKRQAVHTGIAVEGELLKTSGLMSY